MACHASGGLLATAGADRKVLVWDVDGGFCTHYFKGHKGIVGSIMFHPDTDKSLVSSIFSEFGSIFCSVFLKVILVHSLFTLFPLIMLLLTRETQISCCYVYPALVQELLSLVKLLKSPIVDYAFLIAV